MFDLKTKVLIVDDMPMMRQLIFKACIEMGFTNIKQVVDGEKAWEAVLNAVPPVGLIISDWNMPRLTGLDLLKLVRADDRYHNIPFLMITGEAEKHKVKEAIREKVTGFIVKPFSIAMVQEKIELAHEISLRKKEIQEAKKE